MENTEYQEEDQSHLLPYQRIGEEGYYCGYEMGRQESVRGDVPKLTKRPAKRPFLSYIFPFFYSKEVRKNDIFWSKDFWTGYEAGWRDTENALKEGRITNLQVKDGELVAVDKFSD